ncbi:hypothetical protein DVS28_a5082 [Euzebya pacifica]|uniref:N-acetyltransferase domain-containing protein n=1 Tax=Euzebya pacifica TaxID=1608957 RepID=A0A346Y5J1_9ACTN|nr:hypothetical protein [Euzebya pacifica]AXV09738.1 hypothetical protein DVS28_a5082 [Euzebya pacifica]
MPAVTGRVRPLAPGDAEDVRRLFVATAALGEPLSLPDRDLDAYVSLCLDYYLAEDGSACGVYLEDDRVVGYAMVALDHAAYERWVRRPALAWTGRALQTLVSAPFGTAAAFSRRRLLDGVVAVTRGTSPPMPAHFHFNVEGARRGAVAGFRLADHADRVVREAGLPGYFGEVNVPADKPGRARALERLGTRIVHRQRNHTLSWLAGSPVDRVTVVRSLDPTEGWYQLPHVEA